MAGWIARLERGTYDVSSGVQYLGYKRCLNAEAELFSWSVPLAGGAAFYNYFRFENKKRDVLLKYVPGKKGVPPYLFMILGVYVGKERVFCFVGLG